MGKLAARILFDFFDGGDDLIACPEKPGHKYCSFNKTPFCDREAVHL